MNDKQFRDLAIIAAVGFILWWLYNRKNTTDNYIPENMGSDSSGPYSIIYPSLADQSYAANPAGFMPGNININGNINPMTYLSNAYTPIFGFGQGHS